jgi:hypothetical protein
MNLVKKSLRIMILIVGQIKILFCYGLKGNIDDFKNFRQVWSLSPGQHTILDSSTSLSDTDRYNSICKNAVEDAAVFSKFKSNREYREILQHVSREQGWEYLVELEKDPWMKSKISLLVGDNHGKPFRYSYGYLGRVSPTDLRYAKVLSDLYSLFGSLDGFKIAEIGSGYGGQALAIQKFFRVSEYALFDLPWAMRLALKYIANSPIPHHCLKGNLDEVLLNFDLVISNYAFSELRLEIQLEYLEKVILKSKRGFLIYNHINPASFKSLTAIEFSSKVPGAEIFQEIPLTSADNVLIVWGHKSNIDRKRFLRL